MTTALTPGDSFDVLVAGMGPVGKMAALQLARKGHTVLLVDRKKESYPLPRAVAADAEVARILQNAGLPPTDMPEAIEPFDGYYDWVNADGELIHRVDWTGFDVSGWANESFYNQPAVEKRMQQAVDESENITVARGYDVTITSQEDGVNTFDIENVEDGATGQITATFAIAADGARSPARQRLGIEWHDLGYFFDWLVVDILPDESVNFPNIAKQVCDWRGPVTVAPAGPGRRRWEFMLMEGQDPEEAARPENIWPRLEPFGISPENSRMERGVVYQFRSGWAEQYRKGNAFLVGDAAHQMPPFAGQGLASGWRDTINLAWKIDLVLRGKADDRLLDTYTTERINHVQEFIQFSIALGRIICVTDEEEARKRDAAMKAALRGEGGEAPPQPRLGDGLHNGQHGGTLSHQGFITTVKHPEKIRFDDVFGTGAVIAADAELVWGMSAAEIRALGERGIAVTYLIGADDPAALDNGAFGFHDADGVYGDWFTELGGAAVLVRPDFYIYGTASDEAGVQELTSSFVQAVSTGKGLG